MSALHRALWLPGLAILVAVACFWSPAAAADRVKNVNQKVDPSDRTVDLYTGVREGQLEAKLIVGSSSKCRVMLKNLTDRPLNVQLPEAFAGVPVLAQFGGPGGMNNGLNFPANNNNAPQQIGGGFPQNNLFPGAGQGNGFQNNLFNVQNNQGVNNQRQNPFFGPLFSIPAEQVAQFRLECVCLDHGNPDPRPQITYEIRPLDSIAPDKPELAELCAMLARDEIDQRVAQAAAWHLRNNMSWDELKAKSKSPAVGPLHQPFFSAHELAAAKQAVAQAEKLAKERAKAAAGGTSLSQK